MIRISPAASRRFCSLPARLRLSRPKTSASGIASRTRVAIARPTNPQIPVIKIFTRKESSHEGRQTEKSEDRIQESGVHELQESESRRDQVPYALQTRKGGFTTEAQRSGATTKCSFSNVASEIAPTRRRLSTHLRRH